MLPIYTLQAALISDLWKQYLEVIRIIRLKYPSQEEVAELRVRLANFIEYYVKPFDSSGSPYLHFLRDHIANKLATILPNGH